MTYRVDNEEFKKGRVFLDGRYINSITKRISNTSDLDTHIILKVNDHSFVEISKSLKFVNAIIIKPTKDKNEALKECLSVLRDLRCGILVIQDSEYESIFNEYGYKQIGVCMYDLRGKPWSKRLMKVLSLNRAEEELFFKTKNQLISYTYETKA